MKLRTTLAGLSAAAIALSGLILGGTAANAAPEPFPGGGYVPVWEIANNDPVANYNSWHFDPDAAPDVDPGSFLPQYANGFLVPGDDKVLVMLGNGNDIAKTDPTQKPAGTDIEDLATNLSVTSSNQAGVAFQIPVFYDNTGVAPAISWKFTTLRKAASDATQDNWISSRTITGTTKTVAANVETPLADIILALNEIGDARAIGAGFMVDSASDVLVSSFRIKDKTTRFYDSKWTDEVRDNVTEFVHSDAIRPNEDTYAGWHQGVDADAADLGTFKSLDAANGAVNGLSVNGKSQILYGSGPDETSYNNLPEILEAGVSVSGVPSGDAVGYTFQVPIFYYAEGVLGEQFTTLRTDVPDEGGIIKADAVWTSSGENGRTGTLAEVLNGIIDYEILGHGFYIESGNVIAKSVTFNGRTTNFTKAAVVPAAPKGPQPIANTGAVEDMAPMIGIAALALLTLGGVTLAARRRLQQD